MTTFPQLSSLPVRSTSGSEVNPVATDVNTLVSEVNAIRAGSKGIARGFKAGAATLTEDDSGSLCIFNAAAGFTYTLPPAAVGLWFDFFVQTTCTSAVHRVACASGDFLLGTIMQGTDTTFVINLRDADGSTHLAWEGNGTTTGGIKGDWFRVLAISGTQWSIHGFNTATGTEATPFKTS